VVAGEEQPVGSDGQGVIELSFDMPAGTPFVGSLTVELPVGFTLDEATTHLTYAFATTLTHSITKTADNTWLITISKKLTRSGSTTVSASKALQIGYKADSTVKVGQYDAAIKNLSLTLDNGVKIESASIQVPLTVTANPTGTETVSTTFSIYASNSILHIIASQATNVEIYTQTGSVVRKQSLSAGETTISLSRGIYIVKVGNVVEKIVLQ